MEVVAMQLIVLVFDGGGGEADPAHREQYQGPESFSLAEEQRALLEGKSLGRRLVGNWNLLDNATQQVVDQKRATLANVPYLTSMGTFVNNGSDYGISSQLRLRPGIYARQKDSGEVESHVNVSKGFGHRYFLDPATGVFRIQVGQARMPLLPLLKTLGASDDTIRQRWGNELWVANTKRQDPTVLKKLYAKIYSGREAPAEHGALQDGIRKAFGELELDPEVTQRTLGKPYDRLTVDAMLDSLDKLVKIHRGEAEFDDRDAMQYQKVLTPEDLFADRVKVARKGLAQLLWKFTNDNSLKRMPAGAFDKAVRGVLLETGLASALEESNPSEILDRRFRITRMGEGGISDYSAIPDSSRNVQPSQAGYIDPVLTPESGSAGVDLRVAVNTKKGSDGRIYSRFIDAKNNTEVWQSPQDIADKTVAFPKELASGQPYVRAVAKGKLQYVPRESVDFELAHMNESFSPLTNLVPMKSAAKGNRPSMAAWTGLSADTEIIIYREDGKPYRGRIDNYSFQPGDRSLSIDVQTKQLVWKPVRGVVRHRNVQDMVRIQLRSGRYLDASANQCLVTLSASGELIKVIAGQLQPGTPIPRAGRMPVDELTAYGWPWTIANGYKHNAFPAVSLPLDSALGWIHGLYLAEGNLAFGDNGQPRCVQFAAVRPDIQSPVVDFFSRLGVTAAIRSGRDDGVNDRVVVNWKQLCLKLLADFDTGSYRKRIPAWALFAPEDYRRAMLAGYLAG